MTFAGIDINSRASGTAGEYYALSFLIRSGLIACKAPEGTATYDLLAMSPNAEHFTPVQVKTIRNSNHWLLSEHHEEFIPNMIFCFINFTDCMSGTRIFFVPSNVVANAISKGNQIYLTLPNRSGRLRTGSTRRTFEMDYSVLIPNVESARNHLTVSQVRFIDQHRMGWLNKYENNIEFFNT
jgi:hypothetical protein